MPLRAPSDDTCAQTCPPLEITVIGAGYVGLVTGACLAYIGHHVTCVDSNDAKIAELRAGAIPIYEPHLVELIALARKTGAIEFTTDPADSVKRSDVVFIAVGTPPLPTGASDLRFVEAAARQIGSAMDASRRRVIVNKSTVPIGSGNLVGMLVRDGAAHDPEIQFAVASNPEFLREGSAISDSLFPDRIVVGADDAETHAIMERLYRPILDQSFTAPPFLHRPVELNPVPLVKTTVPSAEMVKYAANAFLAMKISFANEIANICERVGAEVADVTLGIGLDSRIGGRFLSAGIGWGGSCFGKDLQSLTHTAAEYGCESLLLEATQEVNRRQRQLIIQKLQEHLKILKGRTIGLLGLSFKPETDDLRDAPSLAIAARLQEMGARVRAYDPVAMDACKREYPQMAIHYCNSVEDVADNADALVLVTEWAEFQELSFPALASRMRGAVVIDGRNAFNADAVRSAGFDYCGIGRGTQRIGVVRKIRSEASRETEPDLMNRPAAKSAGR
jgi:UDPglucose 6-dehydrogenase